MMSWTTRLISAQQRARAERAVDSLLDDCLDSWVCWREACDDVHGAYERWEKCGMVRRGLAFASYRAALDREDQAAHVYSVWTDRLRAATP